MTRTNRRRIERRLRTDRAAAVRALAGSTPDLEPDRSTADRADVATISMEREMDELVSAREAGSVRAIDRALARLAADPSGYERCVVCGDRIEDARLDLVPETRFCARHAHAP